LGAVASLVVFRNFDHFEDRKIKSCLDGVLAGFQNDDATSLLISSSAPNPFLTGLEKSVWDRLEISKTGRNRAVRSLS
jgi:hypothetical protein